MYARVRSTTLSAAVGNFAGRAYDCRVGAKCFDPWPSEMTSKPSIQRATPDDVHELAVMAGELLNEIMRAIGTQAFNFSLADTTANLRDFIAREKYFVLVARGADAPPVGFITLCESYALYAEGVFGIVPELYVRPPFRSQDVGRRLMDEAKAYGRSRGWKRLEVTTPPLPQFDRTLAFYEREGFTVAGGRKLKVVL